MGKLSSVDAAKRSLKIKEFMLENPHLTRDEVAQAMCLDPNVINRCIKEHGFVDGYVMGKGKTWMIDPSLLEIAEIKIVYPPHVSKKFICKDLHSKGYSIPSIAVFVGILPLTVYKYIKMKKDDLPTY